MSEDPEDSFIKTAIAPVVLKVVPYIVTAIIGAVAGTASHSVGDANQAVVVQGDRDEVLKLKQQISDLTAWRDRHRKRDADRLARQVTQDTYLERRLSRIESRVGMQPPPAPPDRTAEDPTQ